VSLIQTSIWYMSNWKSRMKISLMRYAILLRGITVARFHSKTSLLKEVPNQQMLYRNYRVIQTGCLPIATATNDIVTSLKCTAWMIKMHVTWVCSAGLKNIVLADCCGKKILFWQDVNSDSVSDRASQPAGNQPAEQPLNILSSKGANQH